MTTSLVFLPLLQFLDATGVALAGAKLYSYLAGSSTPAALYADPAGLVPLANPAIANGEGKLLAYMPVGVAYKLTLKDANGVEQAGWPIDNITMGNASVSLTGYSATVAQMRLTHDPGDVGTESLAITVGGELERLRFAQLEAKQALDPQLTYWYQSYVKARLPGVNVRMYGAVGDGNTDDTAAVQAACTAGGVILFPPGRYKITATLTLTTGCVLRGMGSHPGAITNASSDDAPAAVLEHHFNGDFLQITGVSGAVEGGVGHGLDNLLLRQHYGDGTAAAGKAIAVVAASDSFKPSWLHIDTVNCEVASGKDHWTYCLHQTGDGTSGATQGTRDTWVGNGRFVSGSHSTAAVSLHCAVNWIAVNLRLDNLSGANAILQATGSDATHASNTLFLSNVTGAAVSLDYANNVRLSNCAFTDFTSTTHSEDVFWCGGALTNAPTLAGLNIALFVLNSADNQLHLYNGGSGLVLTNATGQQKLVIDAETASSCFVDFKAGGTSHWTVNREATTHDLVFRAVQTALEVLRLDEPTGQLQLGRGVTHKLVSPTYGASVAIDLALGDLFQIVVTDGSGFTIANPANAAAGKVFTIQVANQSGGAHGAITMGGDYKMVSGFPVVASSNNQSVTFAHTGAIREIARTSGNVSNA